MSNTILKFTAHWCPPCKQMAPVIKSASEKTGTVVTEVDVDQDKELPSKHNVRGIPTIVLLKDDVEVGRAVGVTSEDALVKLITESFK